jgi:transposase
VPALLRWRQLTEEERGEITRLARAQTAPVRLARRAPLIARAAHGERLPRVAAELGVAVAMVRRWVSRCNAQGLAGLADAPRSGRPATSPPEAVGELLAASLTDPRELGLPFASGPRDRLTADLHEERGIPSNRSRISEVLRSEGWRGHTQATWCGERPDPAFAEQRGPWSGSPPPRLRTAS